jgi:hypothetical protein
MIDLIERGDPEAQEQILCADAQRWIQTHCGELVPQCLSLGCPVCAHFVHYTSCRNRVPPRRGFRVEVQ